MSLFGSYISFENFGSYVMSRSDETWLSYNLGYTFCMSSVILYQLIVAEDTIAVAHPLYQSEWYTVPVIVEEVTSTIFVPLYPSVASFRRVVSFHSYKIARIV